MTIEHTFSPTAAIDNNKTLVFKKWHTYGVCSVQYWHANAKDNLVEKIIIDIADIDNKTKKATQSTKCFVPLFEFMTYLRAEVNDNLAHMFPAFEKLSGKNMAGWTSFGGSTSDNGTMVSRVFKSAYWVDREGNWDKTARAFKCAQFFGVQENPQSAIKPDYTRPISMNQIRLSMADLGAMLEKLTVVTVAENVADLSVGVD